MGREGALDTKHWGPANAGSADRFVYPFPGCRKRPPCTPLLVALVLELCHLLEGGKEGRRTAKKGSMAQPFQDTRVQAATSPVKIL